MKSYRLRHPRRPPSKCLATFVLGRGDGSTSAAVCSYPSLSQRMRATLLRLIRSQLSSTPRRGHALTRTRRRLEKAPRQLAQIQSYARPVRNIVLGRSQHPPLCSIWIQPLATLQDLPPPLLHLVHLLHREVLDPQALLRDTTRASSSPDELMYRLNSLLPRQNAPRSPLSSTPKTTPRPHPIHSLAFMLRSLPRGATL